MSLVWVHATPGAVDGRQEDRSGPARRQRDRFRPTRNAARARSMALSTVRHSAGARGFSQGSARPDVDSRSSTAPSPPGRLPCPPKSCWIDPRSYGMGKDRELGRCCGLGRGRRSEPLAESVVVGMLRPRTAGQTPAFIRFQAASFIPFFQVSCVDDERQAPSRSPSSGAPRRPFSQSEPSDDNDDGLRNTALVTMVPRPISPYVLPATAGHQKTVPVGLKRST